MDHWESLIAERMRPCQKVAVEDYEHTEGSKRCSTLLKKY